MLVCSRVVEVFRLSKKMVGTVTEKDRSAVLGKALVRENWDYYLTEVNGLPATIAVDLALAEHLDSLDATTLYVLQIAMHDGGPDGTGAPVEAHMLHRAEKAIVYEAWQHGFRYIGRVRNNGHWELSFMAWVNQGWQLEVIAESHLQMVGRSFFVRGRPDPQWSFYRSFLYPDMEQLQWMKDRRVTDALQLHGDTLTTPRRIDHVISFDDPRNRDAFRLQCEARGFGSARGEGYSIQVFRTDSVRLENVHHLSQFLSELAAEYTGEYQGWKTRLVKPQSSTDGGWLARLVSSVSAMVRELWTRAHLALRGRKTVESAPPPFARLTPRG